MITKKDIEALQVDANRYIWYTKREALNTIVPHPEEKEERIDLIGLLRGRRPDMYRLFLAFVEQSGWSAMENRQIPSLDTMDAVRFLRSHANSLDGKRSNQVVEIARSETPVSQKSILDMLKGSKK